MTRQRIGLYDHRRPNWRAPGPELPSLKLAVFQLGQLEYAVDIMVIKQIIQPQEIRPVPQAPAFIDGVIERRGLVIPIMDLRRRFEIEAGPIIRANKFIIVRLERKLIGLVVDQVLGFLPVSAKEVRPTPQWITGPEAQLFTGVVRKDDRLVLLLDLNRLVSSGERLDLGGLELHAGEGDQAGEVSERNRDTKDVPELPHNPERTGHRSRDE